MVVLGPFFNGSSLGAATVTVQSPVIDAQSLELVRGDDYLAVESRALSFVFENAPDLTGAVVTLAASSRADGSVGFSIAGEVFDSGGAARFEIPASITSALQTGAAAYEFDISATLSNNHVLTLARGCVNVLADAR